MEKNLPDCSKVFYAELGDIIKPVFNDREKFEVMRIIKTSALTDGFFKSYMGSGSTLKTGGSSHGSSRIIKDLGLDEYLIIDFSNGITVC